MSLMRRRSAALASIAFLTAASALVGPASPASAGTTTYKGCPPGYVCLYDSPVIETATLSYKTQGNVPNGKTFWNIVNNGTYLPGSDHVRFEYRYLGTSIWIPKCLHYLPESGSIHGSGSRNMAIRNMYWGGEC